MFESLNKSKKSSHLTFQKPYTATFLNVIELFTSFCFCFFPYNKDVLSNMPAVSPQPQTESSARNLLAQ